MKYPIVILAVAMLLSGCAEISIPKRGFMTRALLGPETSAEAPAVSQSYRFCVARGYRPGTPDFERCRFSIDSQKQR